MTGPERRPPPESAEPTRGVHLAPIKSTRIYEEIVRQIKAMIAEGRLASGDRLPPERELAEKFLVSRTSVREALRALESLGLVEIRPGEGTFIREASLDHLIEPAIAGLAAARATPDEIQEMQRILESQAREVAAGRTGVIQDAQFHAAIGRAAHNEAITRIAHAVMDLLTQSREESLNTPGRPTRSHQDHRRILEAIARRNGGGAEEAMRDHIAAVEALVVGARGGERAGH
jgi:GntR family transcriptional repressor for pyruvate dehydrogenase complex